MSASVLKTLRQMASLREWSGPFTESLVRHTPKVLGKGICGFCSTGCGLKLHDNGIVTPDADYTVNRGTACPKGWEALAVLDAPDRATTPLYKGNPISWSEAMTIFTEKMRAIGPENAAFISTGQMMTEEMALLGAVAKFGMGILHGDGNTRQCMATSVMAYKESFGFDAPPFTYADFEESDVMIFVGANPCIAHPIMWQRVLNNRRNPKIVVIDPRTTETAVAATMHLPLKPKSDLTLLYGLANEVIKRGGVDNHFVQNHTAGFEEMRAHLASYDLARTAHETELPEEQIAKLADWIVKGTPRVSFWWTMGVNQGHQATRTAQAIINLALMTGNIGKPGTGANSITGQCNAMGSRLFSNTTNLIGGHDFTKLEHREKIACATGIPVEKIPSTPSLAYDQILQQAHEGKIKALWIIATNPAHSWIQQGRFHELARKLDFLVVQDMYHSTETAKLADLVLPAAAWGEKEGTFINSERRIGYSMKVKQPPGQALSDFSIFRLIAEAWGCGEMFQEWSSPEAVFRILQRCSAGQPCDITAIQGYAELINEGGVQWPAAPGRERRLFSDGRFFTPDARARFVLAEPMPPPELPDAEYPLTLITGRGTSAQWHTETRTGKSEVLKKLHPQELGVTMNPCDAKGFKEGQQITVKTRRGSLTARLSLNSTVRPGEIFLPMHDPRVNQLTLECVDPISRQPSYKHCAARVDFPILM
jgi:anaerobic selenocysteine-containing dehydrogenase